MDIAKKFQSWYRDFTCGHCYKKLGYDVLHAQAEWFDEAGFESADGKGFAILKCRNCGFLNTVNIDIEGDFLSEAINNKYELNYFLEENTHILITDWSESYYDGHLGIIYMSLQGQYPYGLEINDNVPLYIKCDVHEAFNCLAINAPHASVMMSRRVIQQIALNFGVKEDVFLGTALNGLKEKGLINDDLYEALMEVKNWGDSGAHPGKVPMIFIEEARKVAELMFILVKTIFPVKDDSKSLVDKLKEIRKGKAR